MIFVTVGHQMPFDRLLELVDAWAGRNRRTDLFAQIGEGRYQPMHFSWVSHMNPATYAERLRSCRAVVSHAGTGTIIQALMLGKPILVLPRLSSLGETRSDHQVGTARFFAQQGQILAASDDADFVAKLDSIESFTPRAKASGEASPELLARIRRFLSSTK